MRYKIDKTAYSYVNAKLIVCFLLASFLTVNAQKLPTYNQFAVKTDSKTAQKVNLKSHPEAKMYRTNLKNAFINSKINFGGKYILTTWGCGTGCLQGAIIDGHTGSVFFPLELQGVSAGSISLGNHNSIEYRKNSNLLIIYGYKGSGFESENFAAHGIYYYQWTSSAFKLLKFVKKNIE